MEKQVLSVEQMQELIALRVDTSKASMEWISQLTNWMGKPIENSKYHLQIKGEGIAVMGDETFDIIPTFTLQDILEMLPSSIKIWDNLEQERVSYHIELFRMNGSCPWEITYANPCRYSLYTMLSNSPIEIAFDMLKWCINKKYIEDEKTSIHS